MGLTRERCAQAIQRLVQQKLQKAGLAGTIEISVDDITAALDDEGRGKGLGAPVVVLEVLSSSSSTLNCSNTSKLKPKAPTPFSTPSLDTTQKQPQQLEIENSIDAVVAHWNETYEPRDPVVAEVTRERLREVLEYPVTVEECKQVLDRVRDNPTLIRRRRARPDISTVFRSVRQVCEVLQRPYVPPSSWLEPFDLVWQRHYKAAIPFGIAAKVLKPLVKQHGVELVGKRLDAYCRQTQAMYVSLPRFAATFGSWDVGAPQRPGARDKVLAGSMVEGL